MGPYKRPQPYKWVNVKRWAPYPEPSRPEKPSARSPMPDDDDGLPPLTEKEKSDYFKFLNTPCYAEERCFYHDLKCGHRIHVDEAQYCGANCIVVGKQNPFVCPHCIIEEVRTEMLLNNISLARDDDEMDDGTREQEIRKIADRKIFDLVTLRQSHGPKVLHRPCKMTEKFKDPKLQFFNKMLKDHGFEGIDPADEKSVPATREPFYNHSLPEAQEKATPAPAQPANIATQDPQSAQPTAQANVWQPRTDWDEADNDRNKLWCTCRKPDDGKIMVACDNDEQCAYKWFHLSCLEMDEAPQGIWFCQDCAEVRPPTPADLSFADVTTAQADTLDDVVGQMNDVRVGKEVEDDATKAVREALDALILQEMM